MEQRGHLEWNVRTLIQNRNKFLEKKDLASIISRENVKHSFSNLAITDTSEEKINEMITWLEKISKYVPISSEAELEAIIKIMVTLSVERNKLSSLYDKSGLDLMGKVRECMIRYLVVLSEYRAQHKEFFLYWHLEDHWYHEWSQVILNLVPHDSMTKYGFPDITVRDFLKLLALELACADSASKLEAPMIRMQPTPDLENKLIFIPTESACKEYQITISKILKGDQTFAEWVREMRLTFCKL